MYKFENFPKKIDIEIYNKQKLDFLNEIELIYWKNNFSLYLIWELELPWVSDLDFLIIVDDYINNYKVLKIVKKYDLIDTPLFIKKIEVNNIEFFTHHYYFEYVWWNKIDENLFQKNNKDLFLIYSWKILFFSWLRNFYIPYFTKNINIKQILNWINDLRYPIYYLSKLNNIDNEILEFIEEYKLFRKTWFEHKDKKKLVIFLEKGINISWKLISILNIQLKLNQKNNSNNLYWRFPTIFSNEDIFSNYKNNSEKYFYKISKRDRFLNLPYSMNYKNWNNDLERTLEKIISINKWFLKFSFDSKILKSALFIKKIFDFLKIKLYEKI